MSNITGKTIRALRERKGLTQKQLGELCGIADSNIRKYEAGKQNPKFETLQKIAGALEVPIVTLLSGSDALANEYYNKIRLDRISDKINEQITAAKHLNIDGLTKDELEDVQRYIEFIKSKRKNK